MKLIALPELRARLGNRARSSLYADIAAGRLPPPIRLGKRVYWPEQAIDARLRELAAEAQSKKGA
jgi:predicted DNA-binding transcriptional regulator AlpA